MSSFIGKQAVVVGAGMSGLTASCALSDHFERVVILERDPLPADAAYRTGTPQSRHLHALLGGGQRALGELLPTFEQDLLQAGAVSQRVGLDIRVERPGFDPFPQRDLGWIGYSMSRPLIELVVRRCVERHPRITLRQHCRAQEFLIAPADVRVTGVRCESADQRSDTVTADLVVDASGRGSLTMGLLASCQQPLPEETIIGVDIAYSTAVFATPGDAPTDWKGVMTFPQAPESSRGALMMPIEGGRWILSIGGAHGDTPPGDEQGFLNYVRHLRTPTIYNAVKNAKRLGDIARFAFPASVHRHFERVKAFPRGLLPVGDAICRFNPIYGQGMSVAAQQACLLRRMLRARATERDPLAELAPAFFAEAQTLIETPWAMAAIPDMVFPQTRGHRPPDFDNRLNFGRALTQLAARDPAVHKLTVEVQHLLKPRSVYRDPELVRRVMAVMAEA